MLATRPLVVTPGSRPLAASRARLGKGEGDVDHVVIRPR